jgi:hypothetical protein
MTKKAVMAATQNDFVEVLAKCEPRIVRMVDARERPEDYFCGDAATLATV